MVAPREVQALAARFDHVLAEMGERVVFLPQDGGTWAWERAAAGDEEAGWAAQELNRMTAALREAGYRRVTLGGVTAWICDEEPAYALWSAELAREAEGDG